VLLVSVPSNPAGRSGSFGAVEELVATAVSNTDELTLAELGPAEPDASRPLFVSHGFGLGGRDEDEDMRVGKGRER
jgi:hypothetical protein